MARGISFILIFLIVITPISYSQTQEGEPYQEEEFPLWLRDLRRFEVIAFGVFPISLMVSSLGYSAYKLLFNYEGAEGVGGFSLLPQYSQEERKGLILSGVILSLSYALTDFIIGKVK